MKIHLCLAHMSGNEMRFIDEAFADNWVVPLGPNVDAFEEELRGFLTAGHPGLARASRLPPRPIP